MDPVTKKELENWCAYIDQPAIDEALNALQLRCEGIPLEKRAPLQKWLMGDYAPTDFQPVDDASEIEAQIKREELRRTFVEKTALEWSGNTVLEEGIDHEAVHPLIRLRQDPHARWGAAQWAGGPEK